jgi:hypothetical protein
MNSSLKKYCKTFTVPLLITVGTLGAIGRYGFMDDYAILESRISGNFDFQIYMSQGRPFSALYSYLIFSFIHNINSLIYLHILGSLTLALFGWLVFTYLRTTANNYLVLIAISVIPILVSPGLLLVSAWAVMSSLGISLFSAVLAAFLIRKNAKAPIMPVQVLLIISFLSYPPSTAIFVVLPCLAWILSVNGLGNLGNQKKLLENVKKAFYNIVSAGLVSLIILKYLSSQYPQTSNRTELIGDIFTKIKFLLRSAIPTALDYFEPKWGFSGYGWLTLVLILAMVFLRKDKRRLIEFSLVMTLGIGATFVPLALTAENWPSNRALLASQWVLATLTVIAILSLLSKFGQRRYSDSFLKFSICSILAISIFHSNNLLITTMKTPQIEELNLARRAIAHIDPNLKVEVKRSEWTDSLAPWVVGDEFGIPSTCQTWVPVPLTKLVLKELYRTTDVEVTLVDKFHTSNALDFSRILNQGKR